MTLSNRFNKILAATVVLGCSAFVATAQTNPAQPAAKPAAPAKASANAPVKTAAKTPAKPAAKSKPAAEKSSQAAKADATPAAGAAPAPAATSAAETSKRDPFVALIDVKKEVGTLEHLPPGKAGLVVATVRVDGVSSSPTGMIAVVSNPEQHVYFLRQGDHLYDGDVENIASDGVTFHEVSKDAFGKAVERTVTKRIYPSAGE